MPRTTAKPRRRSPAPRPRHGIAARRADYGSSGDAFFAKQPDHLRVVLERLRSMIAEVAPEATTSIKWGMPFFTIGEETMCALAAFKSHVNLILPGPPGTFSDPEGLLEGEGKTGKHLKVRRIEEIPRGAVLRWLRTAAQRARKSV